MTETRLSTKENKVAEKISILSLVLKDATDNKRVPNKIYSNWLVKYLDYCQRKSLLPFEYDCLRKFFEEEISKFAEKTIWQCYSSLNWWFQEADQKKFQNIYPKLTKDLKRLCSDKSPPKKAETFTREEVDKANRTLKSVGKDLLLKVEMNISIIGILRSRETKNIKWGDVERRMMTPEIFENNYMVLPRPKLWTFRFIIIEYIFDPTRRRRSEGSGLMFYLQSIIIYAPSEYLIRIAKLL